jgi:hypothetical protein
MPTAPSFKIHSYFTWKPLTNLLSSDISNSILSNDYSFNKITIAILVICIVVSILLYILVTIVCRYKVIVRCRFSRRQANSINPEFNQPTATFKSHQINVNTRNQFPVFTKMNENHDSEPWIPLNEITIRLWGISFSESTTNRLIIL